MIHIIDNYYLDADSRNFILKLKSTRKPTEANPSTFKYRDEGYYPTIAFLLVDLVKMHAHNAIRDCQTLQDAIEDTRAFGNSLKTPLVENLRKAIKESEES